MNTMEGKEVCLAPSTTEGDVGLPGTGFVPRSDWRQMKVGTKLWPRGKTKGQNRGERISGHV